MLQDNPFSTGIQNRTQKQLMLKTWWMKKHISSKKRTAPESNSNFLSTHQADKETLLENFRNVLNGVAAVLGSRKETNNLVYIVFVLNLNIRPPDCTTKIVFRPKRLPTGRAKSALAFQFVVRLESQPEIAIETKKVWPRFRAIIVTGEFETVKSKGTEV